MSTIIQDIALIEKRLAHFNLTLQPPKRIYDTRETIGKEERLAIVPV